MSGETKFFQNFFCYKVGFIRLKLLSSFDMSLRYFRLNFAADSARKRLYYLNLILSLSFSFNLCSLVFFYKSNFYFILKQNKGALAPLKDSLKSFELFVFNMKF